MSPTHCSRSADSVYDFIVRMVRIVPLAPIDTREDYERAHNTLVRLRDKRTSEGKKRDKLGRAATVYENILEALVDDYKKGVLSS